MITVKRKDSDSDIDIRIYSKLRLSYLFEIFWGERENPFFIKKGFSQK